MFNLNDPSSLISTNSLRIRSAYFGSPYGARPINLYSPELTRNPTEYVNAEYRSPNECGNRISPINSMLLSFPAPKLVVVHSPTPSMVRIAASLKGDGKKADAACDS